MTNKTLQESIAQQRSELTDTMRFPMGALAKAAADHWSDRERLEEILLDAFPHIPHCKYLYAIDSMGIQITSNISQEGLIESDFGRERSSRPYMQQLTPGTEYLLSEAYISLRVQRPSLTVMQTVRDGEGALLGYLGADFDMRDLPLTSKLYEEPAQWRQVKGDPAIRSSLFQQKRTESPMDNQLDDTLSLMEELIVDRGVFQINVHFSSSRATVWNVADPFRYRLLDVEMLTDPDIALAFPRIKYPKKAELPAEKVREVLDGLKELRLMDEVIYLRSASVNIFNGLISLTFSCDGSHYLPYDEFLDRDHAFWAGTLNTRS